MRKGEAAALKWSDINFKEKKIHIDETLDFQAENDDELFGDTKTFRSTRTIIVNASLINDLRYHTTWQNQNKIKPGRIYVQAGSKFSVVSKRRKHMPKSTLFNAFQRIIKACRVK